ncbi:MAG TPA: GDSL-type esterase/lipase family protein [Rariglobus sp.]|nr:GDSL-type esterase/lipase family protein [Rariglobus sp.]
MLQASDLIRNLQAGHPQKIVVYGTSLTENGQWPNDLSAWLSGLHPGKVTLINSGLSGKASNTALANLQAKVIAHAPDVVIIEFAVNDAFTAYTPADLDLGITPEKSQANLNRMIDAILKAKPGTEIILQTMNPAWDAPNGNKSASKRPDLAAYYEGYRKVASSRHLLLIDHYANWNRLRTTNPALFQSHIPDGVHPTPAASTAVTFPEIKKVLTK